jgi:hypothetical protein
MLRVLAPAAFLIALFLGARAAPAEQTPAWPEVQGAYDRARSRADGAADALRHAKAQGALTAASTAPVRRAVAEAHARILETRDLLDEFHAAKKTKETAPDSIFHWLCDLLRKLADILHETPVPTAPDEDGPATLSVALDELRKFQKGFESDWKSYLATHPLRPKKDMAMAHVAYVEVFGQLARYEVDKNHGDFLLKFHRAVKAFLPRYGVERDAFKATLKEIQLLEKEFPTLAPVGPPPPGGKIPATEASATSLSPALERAKERHAELTKKAAGIMASRIRME